MLRRFACLFFVLVAVVLAGHAWDRGLQAQTSTTAPWMPPDAVVVAEITRPAAVLDPLLSPGTLEAIRASRGYAQVAARPEFQKILGLVRYLEKRLKMVWPEALRALTAGGVTLAVVPGPGSVLVVDAENPEVLEALHRAIVELIQVGGALQGGPDRLVSRETRHGPIRVFQDGGAYAVRKNRLILASGTALLESVLDRLSRQSGEAPGRRADRGRLTAARNALGSDVDGRVLLDMARLRQHPALARGLARDTNPLAAFLLAGVTDTLRRASWLGLSLHVRGDTLAMHATSDAPVPESGDARAFAVAAGPDQGALPELRVPGRIAALSLYRDLHGFYAAKDTLFPERTSELIFFENMMGIFFSGRDLTEEVMAETRPGLRLVVAEPAFDPAVGTPRVKIPALAVVLRLERPGAFGPVVEEAWQKALGLINFTRGQQGQPGLILDRLTHGQTRFTVAAFSTAGIEDRTRLDDRFNFRPCIALVGGSLILSSTDGLARDLIDALRAEADQPPAPRPGVDTSLVIDGAGVVAAMAANRETLVRQNMIKEGSTRDQAELAIDSVIAAARLVKRATLQLDTNPGRVSARLAVRFCAPAGAPAGASTHSTEKSHEPR